MASFSIGRRIGPRQALGAWADAVTDVERYAFRAVVGGEFDPAVLLGLKARMEAARDQCDGAVLRDAAFIEQRHRRARALAGYCQATPVIQSRNTRP